ncbi:TetR/AcrR family transcriptional regulator C-terminal domain-containing protein [Microbispora sp. H10830]|uniref:TetR/AcrR family transcriptional regulator C-terminal domain-containing protein n=1 Tax=Microbispora sp. H10830 TaxID=2729109 RepID=UPI0016005378|nr:TetR/AcrR family transcriptional regulator C-terminal domain-containing protein [Microbispora sp. H10830]
MSLYRYVPRRDDLFDLMIDLATGEIELPDGPSGDWRGDLTLLARQIRAAGLRHTWLIPLLTSRPTLGPHLLRVHEFALGAFDETGLGIDGIAGLVGMLDDYVPRPRGALPARARPRSRRHRRAHQIAPRWLIGKAAALQEGAAARCGPRGQPE